jgi:RecA/RadA recombinase
MGALATLPAPVPGEGEPGRAPEVDRDRVFSTGFAALDAVLGPGGLPRGTGLSLRGDLSSGRTTLALRLVAEAQAAGAIAAWLDLAGALDPVEAVARGVRPEWFVVLTPASADEGLAMAGSLLSTRTVDLLVIDLPVRFGRSVPVAGVADRLGRLAAMARRAGITLVVLEPPGLAGPVASAVAESSGVRLELERRAWIRLGRDVVGQRTEAFVAKSRVGPPGRRAALRILYAEGGERDACLRREGLLREVPPPSRRETATDPRGPAGPALHALRDHDHATTPPLSAAPPPRPREDAAGLRLVADRAGGPRRPALDGRDRARRGPGGPGAGRPAGDAPRDGAPARAGGDVPRPRSAG